jgi:hypothetical protein
VSVQDELDWRREVTRLWAAVRAERMPAVAHGGWVTARDRLLAEHPCSPADRDAFPGLDVPDHDGLWRVEVPMLAAPSRRLPGPVPGEQVGVLPTPWGDVPVWRLDGHGGGIWVAVRDRGSGRLSSSTGRVLYDTRCGIDLGTGPDGGLVVDLNFLHAPDSAHDPRRTDPQLPPDELLDVVVPVGELLPASAPG